VLFAICAMAPKGMDRARPGDHFTSVSYATGNEVLLTSTQRNPVSFDDERIAALHYKDVLVVVMRMLD